MMLLHLWGQTVHFCLITGRAAHSSESSRPYYGSLLLLPCRENLFLINGDFLVLLLSMYGCGKSNSSHSTCKQVTCLPAPATANFTVSPTHLANQWYQKIKSLLGIWSKQNDKEKYIQAWRKTATKGRDGIPTLKISCWFSSQWLNCTKTSRMFSIH